FNELLLFEDLNLFNQRMAEYLVLYNSKRPHKSLELMTPVDYIWHCCKVSDEAAFCLIQRPYISKTLLTRRISPRGSP
ncbi:IS3 family transposase, partial [Escherichia coli]|uniref:IS3 family transposase n=1 Tax=Escherichia coli TaxID=562 RepID=UPI0039EFF59F